MPRDVDVTHLSPVMPNNKEAVQQLEGDRRDREEIHGSNRFAMIANKSQPAPGQFFISGCSLHPTRDASLGYVEAEHEQFAVDAGSAPGGVFGHHLENQLPHFTGDRASTNPFSDLGDHAPIQAKACTMPADHCFW